MDALLVLLMVAAPAPLCGRNSYAHQKPEPWRGYGRRKSEPARLCPGTALGMTRHCMLSCSAAMRGGGGPSMSGRCLGLDRLYLTRRFYFPITHFVKGPCSRLTSVHHRRKPHIQAHEDVKHGDVLLIVLRATSRCAAASLAAGRGGGKRITIRYPLRICDLL